jgi:hypothetical protein
MIETKSLLAVALAAAVIPALTVEQTLGYGVAGAAIGAMATLADRLAHGEKPKIAVLTWIGSVCMGAGAAIAVASHWPASGEMRVLGAGFFGGLVGLALRPAIIAGCKQSVGRLFNRFFPPAPANSADDDRNVH